VGEGGEEKRQAGGYSLVTVTDWQRNRRVSIFPQVNARGFRWEGEGTAGGGRRGEATD